MKTISALIIFCFLLTACSSSYVVSSTDDDTSVDEFNESVQGEEAEIILSDSTVITATDLYLSADSLHWFNPETKLKTGVAKSEISKVMFTDTWTGGAYGAGAGMIGGASLWIAVSDSIENSQFVNYMGGLAALGVVGAVIGFPIGLIVGYPIEYKFQNTGQARKQ
ncbi:MAG: hypothetical protein ACHQ1D_07355 [Nitrososphaerales archaeon]